MIFVNMVNDGMDVYKRNGGHSFPLMMNSEGTTSQVCTFREESGVLRVEKGTSDDNIFALGGNDSDIPVMVKGAPNLSNKDLKDTNENPLIVVATKSIQFYNDIPTYVKVLFVNEDFFLAMLVYGACAMEFSDGSYVPLQRCNTADIDRKGVHSTYDAKTLKSKVYNKTKGGWDKSYEMVCPLYVKVKGADTSFRCLQNDANTYGVFNSSAIEERLEYEQMLEEKKKEKLAQAELEREERKKRYAENKKLKEAEEIRMRTEALQAKKREQAEKRARSKNKVVNTTDEKGRNTAAEAFLAFVNGGK